MALMAKAGNPVRGPQVASPCNTAANQQGSQWGTTSTVLWIEPMFQEVESVWINYSPLASVLKSCKGQLNAAFDTLSAPITATKLEPQSHHGQLSNWTQVEARRPGRMQNACRHKKIDSNDVTLAVIISIMNSQVCQSQIIISHHESS